MMKIPTEPIGSIPRPLGLIDAIAQAGDHEDPSLNPLYEDAIRDTIKQFEATGSPVITEASNGNIITSGRIPCMDWTTRRRTVSKSPSAQATCGGCRD
jgi:methionine synthase II (cobalamin-independent)